MCFRQKFPAVLLLSLLVGTAGAQADEPPAVEAKFGFASRRVFRGVERAGASAQAAVEFYREGFHGGLETNQPFGSGAREVNLHAAFAWEPTPDLKLEASLAHNWFTQVPGGGADRSLEAGLAATLAPISGFTPGLAYYHDFRFRADSVQVSLGRSIALTKWGTFLDLNFLAGWVTGDDWRPDATGPRLHDSYAYWGGEAQLPYRVGPHSTIVAGLHYADTFGRSPANGPFGRQTRRNLWVSLGVNLDF